MTALQEQLQKRAADLDKEMLALEAEIRPRQERLATLQKQRTALNVLLDAEKNGSNHGAPTKVASRFSGSADRKAYVVPILESLVDLGGKGGTEEVLNRMKDKMEMRGLLGQEDHKDVPGGSEVRWRNTGRWCRLDLVRRGFLRGQSARGVWEITDEGRAWLRKQLV
jgi:hypothetical protein